MLNKEMLGGVEDKTPHIAITVDIESDDSGFPTYGYCKDFEGMDMFGPDLGKVDKTPYWDLTEGRLVFKGLYRRADSTDYYSNSDFYRLDFSNATSFKNLVFKVTVNGVTKVFSKDNNYCYRGPIPEWNLDHAHLWEKVTVRFDPPPTGYL